MAKKDSGESYNLDYNKKTHILSISSFIMRSTSVKLSTFNVREVAAWLADRRLAKYSVNKEKQKKNSEKSNKK